MEPGEIISEKNFFIILISSLFAGIAILFVFTFKTVIFIVAKPFKLLPKKK
jgi:hypothetical protein